VFIGSGSILRNGITIGDNCVIGMGAVVTKSVVHGLTVFGNPAN
jgi:acetyltransferase-like isoleucine patch superfamily enzyme